MTLALTCRGAFCEYNYYLLIVTGVMDDGLTCSRETKGADYISGGDARTRKDRLTIPTGLLLLVIPMLPLRLYKSTLLSLTGQCFAVYGKLRANCSNGCINKHQTHFMLSIRNEAATPLAGMEMVPD